jgi:hypothetical protein
MFSLREATREVLWGTCHACADAVHWTAFVLAWVAVWVALDPSVEGPAVEIALHEVPTWVAESEGLGAWMRAKNVIAPSTAKPWAYRLACVAAKGELAQGIPTRTAVLHPPVQPGELHARLRTAGAHCSLRGHPRVAIKIEEPSSAHAELCRRGVLAGSVPATWCEGLISRYVGAVVGQVGALAHAVTDLVVDFPLRMLGTSVAEVLGTSVAGGRCDDSLVVCLAAAGAALLCVGVRALGCVFEAILYLPILTPKTHNGNYYVWPSPPALVRALDACVGWAPYVFFRSCDPQGRLRLDQDGYPAFLATPHRRVPAEARALWVDAMLDALSAPTSAPVVVRAMASADAPVLFAPKAFTYSHSRRGPYHVQPSVDFNFPAMRAQMRFQRSGTIDEQPHDPTTECYVALGLARVAIGVSAELAACLQRSVAWGGLPPEITLSIAMRAAKRATVELVAEAKRARMAGGGYHRARHGVWYYLTRGRAVFPVLEASTQWMAARRADAELSLPCPPPESLVAAWLSKVSVTL